MDNVTRVAWQCERLGRTGRAIAELDRRCAEIGRAIAAVNARGIGPVTGQALARQLAPRSSVAALGGVGGRIAAVLRSLGARSR
jgi:hypothetical protein